VTRVAAGTIYIYGDVQRCLILGRQRTHSQKHFSKEYFLVVTCCDVLSLGDNVHIFSMFFLWGRAAVSLSLGDHAHSAPKVRPVVTFHSKVVLGH
jgi:hypothetical protein